MAPRSKTGNTPHERRNAYLRERTKKVLAQHDVPFEEFLAQLQQTAKAENLRWYKGRKDQKRSILSWLEGSTFAYYWILDVVERTVINIASNSITVEDREQVEPKPEKSEPLTVSSGTQGELDALRNIVTVFVPLKPDARDRILAYLGSL